MRASSFCEQVKRCSLKARVAGSRDCKERGRMIDFHQHPLLGSERAGFTYSPQKRTAKRDRRPGPSKFSCLGGYSSSRCSR
jgi:hypothetical protein